MSPAIASSLGIAAYLALFAGVGLLFIFVNLLVGRFLRPSDPHREKLEIYECGEPAIGSSFVQFDLRFYVVALLFIIFDVEIAFFFPWATVFGKATHMMDRRVPVSEIVEESALGQIALTSNAKALYREMGVRQPTVLQEVPNSLKSGFSKRDFKPGASAYRIDSNEKAAYVVQEGARQLAWITLIDIGVFFSVLMVGFAYVWRRGDLNWVRAVSRAEPALEQSSPAATKGQQSVLSA